MTLIASYPSTLLLPESVSDAEIGVSSKIRINKRFPTLVWHSNEHDCSIWRASCIDPNLMMDRCPEDEKVLKAIALINPAKKLFIFDAREDAKPKPEKYMENRGLYRNTEFSFHRLH